MTKSEIMNCAAILAAGIMANDNSKMVYTADSAVELMRRIAVRIELEDKLKSF